MGAGKTTIGKKLAKQINYTFLDTDEIIEKQEGCNILTLVETKGMDYFRNCEKELSKTLPNYQQHVISTGGGLPIDTENQHYIKKTGKIIFINTPFDIIWGRLKSDVTRPLILNSNKKDIQEKYLKRIAIYKSLDQVYNH